MAKVDDYAARDAFNAITKLFAAQGFLTAASQLEGATITPEFAQSLKRCCSDLTDVTNFFLRASFPTAKGGVM